MGFRRGAALCLLATGIFGSPVFASEVLSSTEFQARLKETAAQSLNANLTRLLRSKTTTVADVKTTIASVENNEFFHELAIYTLAMEARRGKPSVELLDYLSSFKNHKEQTRVWHDEGPLPLRAFGLKEAVTGTILFHERKRRSVILGQAMQSGDWSALGALRQNPPNDIETKATLQAVSDLPISTLSQLAPLLKNDMDRTPVQAALSTVAIKTSDANLTSRLLQHSDPAIALKLVGQIKAHFDSQTAETLFVTASLRSELASRAMMALGSQKTESAFYFLYNALGSTNGSSAAAALARHGGPDQLASVALLFEQDHATEQSKRDALLALRLTPRQHIARPLLADLIQRDVLSPTLYKKAQQWLNR